MAGPDSFRPSPQMRFAVGNSRDVVSAQPTPRQNQILAALPRHDYERLVPDLEPFALALGWTVHEAGDREKYLYFLTAGIVSRFYMTASGASAEFAVTGNEGVVGIASFLGGESTPSQAVVLSPGYSYRLRADRLKHEFARDGPLPRLLLRYTQALIGQIGLISACRRHHSLEQRLCRWLLSSVDRLPTNDLALTQGLIANMLGVRREGVTEAAGKLQEAGLIHLSRGRVVVLDRPGLEAQVCECYGVVKRNYDRLLADYRGLDGDSRAPLITRAHAFSQQSEVRV
jgi:CRP-like cAMP-binding protein